MEDVYRREAKHRYESQLTELVPLWRNWLRIKYFPEMLEISHQWTGATLQLTYEDQVKLLDWLRNYDPEGMEAHELVHKIVPSSTGDLLFVAKVTLKYHVGVESWRYYEVADPKMKATFGITSQKPKEDLDKTEVDLYRHRMEQYEYEVGRKHDFIALQVLSQLGRAEISVPCDGLGRFAKFHEGEGTFTDLNIHPSTHVKVKPMSLKEHLQYFQTQRKGVILILMYGFYLLDYEDRQLIEKMVKEGRKILIIDTREEVSTLPLQRVNNMTYAANLSISLPAFPHDTLRESQSIKFSEELLKLANPICMGYNQYRGYFNFMKPYHQKEGDPVIVTTTIKDFLKYKDVHKVYFVLSGLINPPVLPFRFEGDHFSRYLYTLPASDASLIPPSCYREIIGDEVYFLYTEEEQVSLLFKGVAVRGTYNSHVTFYSAQNRQDEEVLDLVMKGKGRYGLSKAQIQNLLSSWYNCTFFEAEARFHSLLPHLVESMGLYYKKFKGYQFKPP